MKNFIISGLLIVIALNTKGQVISGSSLFSSQLGGARILSGQGNFPTNPAIGFQSSVSSTSQAQNDGGGGLGIYRPAANEMAFCSQSAERMRITSSGNIGIGSGVPLHKIHLHNGAMMISGSNNMGGPMIVFSDNVTSNAYPNGRWGIEYESNAGGLNFWQPANPAFGSHVNYSLFLKNNGNIGIGLSNPATKLHVNGGIRLNDRGQKISFLGDDVYIERPLLTDGLMMNAPDIYIRSTLTPINMMSASTIMMNNIAGNTTMLVNPQTQKVGIGTTTPTSKLEVVPSNAVGIVVSGNSSTFVGSDLGLNRTTTSTNAGQGCTFTLNDQSDITNSNMIQAGLGNLQFLNNGTGSWVERMRIAKSGNVGIGTTTPTADLHVANTGNLILERANGGNQNNALHVSMTSNGVAGASNTLPPGTINFISKNTTPGINPDMTFSANGTAHQLLIKNNGNIGIGTIAPSSKLEINNVTTGTSGLRFTQLNAASSTSIANGKALSVNASGDVILVPSAATSALSEWTRNGSDVYTNNTSDKVGIGTNTPHGLLEIKNELNNQAGIVLSGKEYYINYWNYGNNNGIALINGVNRDNNKQLWIADADSIATKNSTNGVLSIYPTTEAAYISSHATDGITPLKLLLNVNGGNVGVGTVNPIAKMHVDGNVFIGSATHNMPSCSSPYTYMPAGYKLYVEGGILTEKLRVAVKSSCKWADYVFAADYNLKPLDEVETFVKENKHLPGIPSANELVSEGLDVAEMQAKQMEKIEELTLYMIAMKKENDLLKKEVSALKKSFTNHKN